MHLRPCRLCAYARKADAQAARRRCPRQIVKKVLKSLVHSEF
jgi:hypothetical protein